MQCDHEQEDSLGTAEMRKSKLFYGHPSSNFWSRVAYQCSFLLPYVTLCVMLYMYFMLNWCWVVLPEIV